MYKIIANQELKFTYPDRWLRIYSLSKSKRSAEYKAILDGQTQ